jgi:hypothetical protein
MEREQIEMKQLKIAGLCLASMLVMSMALAGNASAQPLWLVCLEGTGLTKYSNGQCTKAESSGKFQSLEIPSGVDDTVRLLALTLLLTDLSAGPLKEKATIRCPHPTTGWGLILAPNVLLVTKAKVENPATECEREEGPCKAGEIEGVDGVHLPWKVEVFETESSLISKIEPTAAGGGEPGWLVKCNTLLGSKTDECVSEGGGTLEETLNLNATTEGVLLVRARFLTRRLGKCSEGGAKTGEVRGLIAILLNEGNGLSIYNV